MVTLIPIPLPTLPLPICGPRVVIRELAALDVPTLYEIESDIDVKRYTGGPVKDAREFWISQMAGECPTPLTLAIALRSSGEFLGRASLNRAAPFPTEMVKLEIVLGKSAWHGRYGREVAELLLQAAANMQVRRVQATVHPENSASLALLAHFQFKRVGVKNDHLVFELPLLPFT